MKMKMAEEVIIKRCLFEPHKLLRAKIAGLKTAFGKKIVSLIEMRKIEGICLYYLRQKKRDTFYLEYLGFQRS